jgi:hypothetical protein
VGGVDEVGDAAVASDVSSAIFAAVVVVAGVVFVVLEEGLSRPRGEAGVLSRDRRAYGFSGDIDLARSAKNDVASVPVKTSRNLPRKLKINTSHACSPHACMQQATSQTNTLSA